MQGLAIRIVQPTYLHHSFGNEYYYKLNLSETTDSCHDNFIYLYHVILSGNKLF